ncbi:MAG: hypothetical protein HDR03_11730 [Lachnospiraceae bacterium]|nr:hypothetical protein [Lachnospiraceae bacterium]
MKKRSKIIIARIIAALMVFCILPLDMLTTANEVMAQELGDNAESASTIDNEAGDSDNDANIGNLESNGDDKYAGLDEKTPDNTDSSNGEGSDNKEDSKEEGSDNTDSSDTEGSDKKDDSDAENSDDIGEEPSEEEDSETTSGEEEGLEDASVETSEEETAVKAASTVRASGFSNVGGWFESIYAEIAGVEAADVSEVSYTGAMTGKLSTEDLKYLVRDNGSDTNKSVRIDIPGLKAGTYTLTVKVGTSTLAESGITVSAYDRSGYAHFNYTEGVGAYNDDGTLKDNAIVLYVTDENKNKVTLTVGNTTVTGIGNILNSAGQEKTSGLTSNGGKANTNQGIIKELAKAGKPLVVRFIGTVSNTGLYEKGSFDANSKGKIDGLTAYSSLDNGGAVGDNGHLARIQSGKDITLEGIGYDATIDGWGFHYIAQSSDSSYGKSFEVRNLTFINTPEDAVGMEGSQKSKDTSSELSASVERCWIHNNEFYCPKIENPAETDKGEGDGSVDFKRGQYFTCSYNYFEGCHKTHLVGSDDTSLQFNLTYHHNHWYMCNSRGPLSRNANIHMYNNIVDMQTYYAQNVRADAYIFSEYNMFYACVDPQKVESGAIKSYHDSISSVIWNDGTTPGTIVEEKTVYVPNECQFKNKNIKYNKFDVDSKLSYIPTGDYILEEDFTKLRKIIKSQAGVQDREPKLADELSSSDYSMIPSDTTVNPITLPYDKAPGKNKVFAFSVGQNFDLEVKYSSGTGVLVNEAGENLLEGDGSVINLPKGTYWIQSVNISAAKYASRLPATFKDITISKLKITPNSSAEHDHNWVLDTQKSKDATCTEAGKKVYTCSCNETKEESIAALGHNYSDWTVTKPATDTEAGSKERKCSRCGDKQTDVIPAMSDDTIYYIKFDTNGGSLANTSAEVSSSQIYKITQKPTREGYAFAGWYTEREGGKLVDYIDGSKLSESCTVYAHWNLLEKNTHSLDCSKDLDSAVDDTETKDNKTYDTITTKKTINGFTLHVLPGTVGSTKYYMTLKNSDTDNVKVLYTNGVLLQADQDPMLKAIEFKTSANSVLTVETALSGNPETGKTYRLVLAKDGAPAGSEQKHNITQGRTKVTETFEISEAGKYYLYPEGDKGLIYYSLNVIEQQYTIVYKPGSAAASGDFASVVAKAGEEITLPVYKVAEGYTFTGWSLDGSTLIDGDKYTVKSEDASADNVITITALYTATEYDIAYDPGEGTLPTEGLPQKGTTGQTLTLGNCTPANTETHRFVGWSVGDSKPFKNYLVKPTDVVNGAITLRAVYREIPQLYTIKYEVGDGTLPAGKADTEQAYTGDVINLPVCTPPAEKQFLGWNKKGSADYIETYTVKAADADSDKTIIFTAVYGDVGYTYYTVTLNPNGGTLSDSDVEVRKAKKDEQINPGKCTKEGYRFIGWSVNDEIVELPYTVTGDVTLTAVYEKAPSHKGIAIVGLEPTYDFTGAKIIPNIAVVDYDIEDDNGIDGHKALSLGVDYTVKYANNNKVSTADKPAKVTVTGKGNYAGKDTQATFKIVEPKATEATEATLEDLKGAKLSKINPVDYNGEAQYPEIELKLKNGMPVKYTYDKEDEVYKKKEGTDQGTEIGAKVSLSNNINKGTATILLTGKNGANGKPTTIKKTFKITAIDLSKAESKLTVTADPATYSVKGAVPKLTVHYKDENIDKDLINGVDYTVKYSSNKKVGVKGKIAITGKGNYAKKYTAATYDINPLVWSAEDTGNKNPIKAVQVYAGLKAVKVKATVVDKDGNALKPSQYTLKVYKKNSDGNGFTEYTKSDDALEANDVIYVEATAKEGNKDITGTTAKAEFKVGNNIAKAKVVLNKVNGKAFTAQYTGKEIELKESDLTVTMNGVTGNLKMKNAEGEGDYEIVSYSNNINKGTATAVIKGIGSYSGTKTVKFKIVGKTMAIGEENRNIPWSEITSQFKSFMNGILN